MADLQRDLRDMAAGTFKVRYRVTEAKKGSSTAKAVGEVTHYKEGGTQRVDFTGDVEGTGTDQAIVLINGANIYYCSKQLEVAQGERQRACTVGAASGAIETAALLLDGIGLPLRYDQVVRVEGVSLHQTFTTRIAGEAARCYDYGRTTTSSSDVARMCFSDNGAPLLRRIPLGATMTIQLEAVEVSSPRAQDFAVPYPIATTKPQ